jgi:hypothetical protein
MTITSLNELAAMREGAVIHHSVHGDYVKQADGRWKNPRYKHPVNASKVFKKSVANGRLTTVEAPSQSVTTRKLRSVTVTVSHIYMIES